MLTEINTYKNIAKPKFGYRNFWVDSLA